MEPQYDPFKIFSPIYCKEHEERLLTVTAEAGELPINSNILVRLARLLTKNTARYQHIFFHTLNTKVDNSSIQC